MQGDPLVFRTPKKVREDFFKTSAIWQDICLMIDDFIEAVHVELENPKLMLQLRDLDHRSGVIEALRKVKEINIWMELQDKEVTNGTE